MGSEREEDCGYLRDTSVKWTNTVPLPGDVIQHFSPCSHRPYLIYDPGQLLASCHGERSVKSQKHTSLELRALKAKILKWHCVLNGIKFLQMIIQGVSAFTEGFLGKGSY